jgi:hypothetical protein
MRAHWRRSSWIGFDGEFVLRILGLRFDQVFVGAFLNVEFVVGHGGADGFVRRFRQQVNEKTVPGVQAFSLFPEPQGNPPAHPGH